MSLKVLMGSLARAHDTARASCPTTTTRGTRGLSVGDARWNTRDGHVHGGGRSPGAGARPLDLLLGSGGLLSGGLLSGGLLSGGLLGGWLGGRRGGSLGDRLRGRSRVGSQDARTLE